MTKFIKIQYQSCSIFLSVISCLIINSCYHKKNPRYPAQPTPKKMIQNIIKITGTSSLFIKKMNPFYRIMYEKYKLISLYSFLCTVTSIIQISMKTSWSFFLYAALPLALITLGSCKQLLKHHAQSRLTNRGAKRTLSDKRHFHELDPGVRMEHNTNGWTPGMDGDWDIFG